MEAKFFGFNKNTMEPLWNITANIEFLCDKLQLIVATNLTLLSTPERC